MSLAPESDSPVAKVHESPNGESSPAFKVPGAKVPSLKAPEMKAPAFAVPQKRSAAMAPPLSRQPPPQFPKAQKEKTAAERDGKHQ